MKFVIIACAAAVTLTADSTLAEAHNTKRPKTTAGKPVPKPRQKPGPAGKPTGIRPAPSRRPIFRPSEADLNPLTRRPVQTCALEVCFATHSPDRSTALPFDHNTAARLLPARKPPVSSESDQAEDRSKFGICRLDGADTYYESLLELPKYGPPSAPAAKLEARSCPSCSLQNGDGAFMNSITDIAKKLIPFQSEATRAGETQAKQGTRISRECIARALQRSHLISQHSKCASPESRLQTQNLPPHCPTNKLVDFLHAWSNAALKCVDPAGSSNSDKEHLKLDPEFVFAIINHESSWNINATKSIGNGNMQLTTDPVLEFLRPGSVHGSFWPAVRDKPECEPFREQLDNYTKFPKRTWQCSVTHPKAIGTHYIIGLTNLNNCQHITNEELERHFNWNRVKTIKAATTTKVSQYEENRIRESLVAICHNWGSGNMKTALRAIARLTFRDSKEFRDTLVTKGWAASAGDGTKDFPKKVEVDLQMIKRAYPQLGNEEIDSCAE